MPDIFSVAVLVGSLRKDSINRQVAKALIEIAPPSLKLSIVDIGQMPFYNPDDEDKAPAPWTEFRNAITTCHAVLFVTPEYNRSVPAVLKNALDVGSRPYGKSVWNAKPGAVISASPGAAGGFGANHHLRQVLIAVNIPAMAQPEVYLSGADKLFDASGKLANESTKAFLTKFMTAFAAWILANSAKQ